MSPADPRSILPEPPDPLKASSRKLVARMRKQLESRGRLPFSDYMEMALYEPGLGYYSAGLAKLGETGDFVTAPELGDLFARCLARQAGEIGAALDGDWTLLEIGAGSGRMAADVLLSLEASGRLPSRYLILERSADLRALQARTLSTLAPDLAERVSWLDAPPGEAWQGVLLANEVLDALAVERFHITPEGPARLGVRIDDEGIRWEEWPAGPELAGHIEAAQARLDEPLPEGYRSEICPLLRPWLDTVTRDLERGVCLFVDYGYPRSGYYHPERREGTLVCQYRHRAHFDPFTWPGLQDISAFVDFTALAEAALAAELDVAGYAPQSFFLFGCGLEELVSQLCDLPDRERRALAHQVRELTLPGAMGEKFQVMALARDFDAPLRGFSLLDQRERL